MKRIFEKTSIPLFFCVVYVVTNYGFKLENQWYLLWISAMLLLIGILFPKLYSIIFKYWMITFSYVGKLNTRIILLFIYIFIITSYGVITKLFGMELLDEKIDNRKSYKIKFSNNKINMEVPY